VVPDPAWDVDKLWTPGQLLDAREALFRRKGLSLPERTLAFHLNNRYLQGLNENEVGSVLDRIAENMGAVAILVPMAPTHGDILLAQQVAAQMSTAPLVLDDALGMIEIASCLGTSILYVGSAMHGFITASAYGVPALCITDGSKIKFSGVQSLFKPTDIHCCSWKNLVDVLAEKDLRTLGNKAKQVHANVCQQLDMHWDRICGHFRESASTITRRTSSKGLAYRLELLESNVERYKKFATEMKKERNGLYEINKKIKREIENIKGSTVWKIARVVRQVSQRFPRTSALFRVMTQAAGILLVKLNANKIESLELPGPTAEEIAEYKKITIKSRIVVYTCITSGYDSLMVPEVINNSVDYICFSESPIDGHGVWKIKPIPFHHPDPVRVARFVKTHPHLLLQDYDIAIWVDGNILIRNDLQSYIDKIKDNGTSAGFIVHPLRNCIYEEADACLRLNKDDSGVIHSQMEYYKNCGFPHNAGMYETNFFIVRLENNSVKEFFSRWWNGIQSFSRRDQLSVIPAIRSSFLTVTPLLQSGSCLRTVKDFMLIPHIKFRDYVRKNDISFHSNVQDPLIFGDDPIVFDKQIPRVKEKNTSVDIIICVYNALGDLRKCFESVEVNRDPEHRIILVNDKSDPDTTAYLRSIAEKRNYVLLLENEKNLGYTKTANVGLMHSTADLSILLNSDTIVTRDWANKLAELAYSAPTIGIVGPLSNAASYQSIPSIKSSKTNTAINAIPCGLLPEDLNEACEKWAIGGFPAVVPLVHGFCFGVRRDVIEKVGYFDDVNFDKYYGEENDYCFRAIQAGFDLAIAMNTYVFHKKSMSISEGTRIVFMKKAGMRLREIYGAERVRHACMQMEGHPLLQRVRKLCTGFYRSQV
jgi:GT2 family glycosyltransferase